MTRRQYWGLIWVLSLMGACICDPVPDIAWVWSTVAIIAVWHVARRPR